MTKTSTIPERQISHYLHGWCPQLAGVIWAAVSWQWQQGWSLAIVTTDDGESGHIITRTPSGEYLDIRGLWTADEMRAAYPDAQLLDVEADWLAERGWDLDAYGAHDLRVAQELFAGLDLDPGEMGWELAQRNVEED